MLLVIALAAAAQPAAQALLRRGPRPCSPPQAVQDHAAAHGLALLAEPSATHAVYGAEDEEEVNVLIFDCVQHKKLMFLHIPKNAGTTIEDLAKSSGVQWGRFQTLGTKQMPDGNQCSAWHTPPHLFGYPNPYSDPNAEVFCVTRDPWQRMVSEYMYLLSVYYKWPMKFVKDGPECTVDGLNMFVQHSISRMDQGFRYLSDCHMLPQWDYIEGGGQKWCDHTLPIGDLTTKFNSLMQQSGLHLRMAPHNKANSASSQCPNLRQRSEGPRYGDVFYPKTQAAMRGMYWQDFQNLGDSLKQMQVLVNSTNRTAL